MAPIQPPDAAIGHDADQPLRTERATARGRGSRSGVPQVRRGLGALLLWCHRLRSRPVDLGADAWIVAPHQDDEVLGCGGTIALKRRSGAQVRVVFVTDGSMSHGGVVDRRLLVRRRAEEALRACEMLGVPADHVHFLALTDGSLNTQIDECADGLRQLFDRYSFPQVFVPSVFENPSDHLAAREAALTALRDAEQQRTVIEYGVWCWHDWPMVPLARGGRPLRRLGRRAKQLARTARWLWACRFAVDISSVAGLKERALRAHASQALGLPGAPRAPTLYDVGNGEFVARLMGPREIFGIPARGGRRGGT